MDILKTNSILDNIVEQTRKDVLARKTLYPKELLMESAFFHSPTVSLASYVRREDKSGIIAEFKRKSPSEQNIHLYADPEAVTIGYMQAGASALSVLTDGPFFGGSNKDLTVAREFNFCPILRKDFIVDPYQVIEARSIGADAILLIADILPAALAAELAALATSMDMEVLFELYDASGIDKLTQDMALVGVNNRDLKSFEVDLDRSEKLRERIPYDRVAVAESGMKQPQDVTRLRQAGYEGFLIGSHFMRSPEPALTCRQFIRNLEVNA